MRVVTIPTSVPYDSNIYLLSSGLNVLIDAGTGLDARVPQRIRDVLGGGSLDAIVLTHCHADHIGGVPDIVSEFGCPVYIGSLDLPYVRDADPYVTYAGAMDVDIRPVDCRPLEDGDAIDLGGEQLTVMYTPGHTVGSICLYDPTSGTLFSGDTLFMNGYGRTDLPTGSYEDLRHSLQALNKVNIRKMYPGHGPVCDNVRGFAGSMSE